MAGTENAPKEKFVPISQRLSDALKGWNNEGATALELDSICHKVKDIYANLTWEDLINERFLRIKDKRGIGAADTETLSFLSFKTVVERNSLQNQKITEFNEGESINRTEDIKYLNNEIFFEAIGIDLHHWLEEALQEGKHNTFAQATYIIFNTENPFLSICPKVSAFIRDYLNKHREKLPEITTEGIKNIEYFIQEENFTAHADFLNDWGYCQETSQVYFELLKDRNIGPKLFGDTILFANVENAAFYPAQMFAIFEEIRRKYPRTRSYQKAIKLFYQDHPDGIFKEFNGKLNIKISGMQRSLESESYLDILGKGALLSFFSGPPIVAKMEAQKCGINCITIDIEDEATLKSVHQGGNAVFVNNELLPGQNRKLMFRKYHNNDKVQIKHLHIQAGLPEEKDYVEEKIPTEISVITDKRGSLLYLKGEKLLEHLRWLYKTAGKNSTECIYFSKGISRHMLIDLMLRKNVQGWQIAHTISSLRFGPNNLSPADSTTFAMGIGSEQSLNYINSLLKDFMKKIEMSADFKDVDIRLFQLIFSESLLNVCGQKYLERSGLSSCDGNSSLYNYFRGPDELPIAEEEVEQIIVKVASYFKNLLKTADHKKSTTLLEINSEINNKQNLLLKAISLIPVNLIYEVLDVIISNNEFSTALQGINVPENRRYADKLSID